MVQSLTSAHWHHSQIREHPWGAEGKQCYWHLSAHSFAEGQRDLGHTSCGPLPFPMPPKGVGVSQ